MAHETAEPLESFPSKLSFQNSALQSWIPSAVLGVLLIFAGLGVLLFLGASQLWHVSVTLGVFGVSLLLRASQEDYLFDGESRVFTMTKKRLFRTKNVQLNFREIKDVKLEESVDTQGTQFPSNAVCPYSQLQAGRRLTCTCFCDPASGFTCFRAIYSDFRLRRS